ncbi:hypothetical protein IAQ61_007626 [Plenodomus lingam]|uniref:uncharacterized protein n=1 Tax=Leptosphaeria maculans TaxID=5022 RepID=UPI003333AB5D|nr:hypothetical protein IAQ61_007626 [Plenodomus lingam]
MENTTVITSQNQHPYSEEVQKARAGISTYGQAFQALYDRRNAFSSAYPFSARVVDFGNSFVYQQGTLSILNGSIVQVLGIHPRSDPVRLNLSNIIQPVLETAFASAGNFNVSLLYYSDSILAVHVTKERRQSSSYIFAIDTTPQSINGRRVVNAVQIPSSFKIFVRHTARYLYYGTHTGLGDDGHHKWEIDGFALDKNFALPHRTRPLLLEGFHGTDVGSTVAFEIHNDWFYAVSNQGIFDVEEIDDASFYHLIRFPISNPTPDAMETNDQLYRRHHNQGPIHDSWTDLTLQLDERTNETVIVESRREWAQASSRQSRTFYVTRLDVEPANKVHRNTMDMNSESAPPLPDDILTALLGPEDKPHYMPTPAQHSESPHSEFSPTDPSPRSFILARTKFRTYNYSCTSFLDLVEDERCCPDNGAKPPCLRLRIGSRREYRYGLESTVENKGKQCASSSPLLPHQDLVNRTRYKHGPTRMWPPPSRRCPCARRLHDILSPRLPSGSVGQGNARTVVGVLDDRSLAYMIKPGRAYGARDAEGVGAVVVVEFCRPVASEQSCGELGVSASSSTSAADTCVDAAATDAAAVNASVNATLDTWQWTPGLERRCRAGTCH